MNKMTARKKPLEKPATRKTKKRTADVASRPSGLPMPGIPAAVEGPEALIEAEERYRLFQVILRSTSDGILAVNRENEVIFANERFVEMWMIPPEMMDKKDDALLLQYVLDQLSNPQDFIQKVHDLYNSSEESFDTLHFKDGRVFDRLSRPMLQGTKVFGRVWSFREVTESKRVEEELQFRNILLSTQQEAAIDGILIVDEKNHILTYNRRFIDLWGIPPKLVEARVDEPVLQFVTAQMADPQSFFERVKYLYEHRHETSRDELILSDGRVFDRYSAPIFRPVERYFGRVWYFRDISERRRVEEELRRAKAELETLNAELQESLKREQELASIDGLTGLCNHRYLFELADREFHAAIRYQVPLTFLMFDLDNFKRVNDTLGHSAGNRLLTEVAQTTVGHVRTSDVVARYGGDEFVIMLPFTSARQALPVAERIRASISAICVGTDKEPFRVTLSIGIAELRREPLDENVEHILQRADEALYKAKQGGRNRVAIFGEGETGAS